MVALAPPPPAVIVKVTLPPCTGSVFALLTVRPTGLPKAVFTPALWLLPVGLPVVKPRLSKLPMSHTLPCGLLTLRPSVARVRAVPPASV